MFSVQIKVLFHYFIFINVVAIFRRCEVFSIILVSFLCTKFVSYIIPSKISAMQIWTISDTFVDFNHFAVV